MKSSPKDIISAILAALDRPKSIRQVAQECGINWESARKYMQVLAEAGVLEERQGGKARVFVRKDVPRDPENFFGLPLDKKMKEEIDALYGAIERAWMKKHGSKPGRVQVQKLLRKLDRQFNLELPMGWYLYGLLCVRPYDPGREYSGKVSREIERAIWLLIEEIGTDAYSAMRRQYAEEGKELYIKTLELRRLLLGGSRKEVEPKMYEWLKYLPKMDTESNNLVNEWVGSVTDVFRLSDPEELKTLRSEFIGVFEDIWKLVALFNFQNDMRRFYGEMAERYLAPSIALQKFYATESLKHLVEITPEETLSEKEKEFIRKIRAFSPQ